jgi:hypothetical protein
MRPARLGNRWHPAGKTPRPTGDEAKRNKAFPVSAASQPLALYPGGLSMSSKTVILIFTLVIYILILIVFSKARKKYAGGKVGEVVNLILFTVMMLFAADYVGVLEPVVDVEILDTVRALLRTCGLGFLAYGGSKVAY